jgi:A/G-specific adenine glycosylase
MWGRLSCLPAKVHEASVEWQAVKLASHELLPKGTVLDQAVGAACTRKRPGMELDQPMSATNHDKLQQGLLRWFFENGRDLPWRRGYSSYAVWISEIMLQQTQVKTVIPYFERWMARFPGPAAIAKTPLEEVFRAWEGLGYYVRAQNIHRTARILVRDSGGKVPPDHGALLKLPGVGRYTAGAIMSIAFNQDFAAVDANIGRILCRIFNIADPPASPLTHRTLWARAQEILPTGQARYFNQGLMDLGALVCLPDTPRCDACPVSGCCESLRLGIVSERPAKKPPKAATPIEAAVGVIVEGGRVFIQKRPENGLLPNLWEFPGGKVRPGETPEQAVVREIGEETGLAVRPTEKLALIRHSYTSFRVTLHAYLCEIVSGNKNPQPGVNSGSRWVIPEELDRYPVPAANRKLIKLLLKRLRMEEV